MYPESATDSPARLSVRQTGSPSMHYRYGSPKSQKRFYSTSGDLYSGARGRLHRPPSDHYGLARRAGPAGASSGPPSRDPSFGLRRCGTAQGSLQAIAGAANSVSPTPPPPPRLMPPAVPVVAAPAPSASSLRGRTLEEFVKVHGLVARQRTGMSYR
ncbi:unnamed protein product [Lampetra fluviatilis]